MFSSGGSSSPLPFTISPAFKRLPGVSAILPRPTAPLKSGWTDEMCLAEGKKCCVWREIPANEIAGHLTNFMNLWFAPEISELTEMLSIIINILLMMPREVGSDELLLKDVFDSAIETAKSPTAINDKELIIREPFLDHLNAREKTEVRVFHEWLKRNLLQLKMLEKKTSPGQPRCSEYNLVSQKLRAVLGFCALVSMQLIVKGERQIKGYFHHHASTTFDRLFPKAELNYVPLVAPALPFLEHAKDSLSNSDSTVVRSLFLLMFQYLKSVSKDDESSQRVKQILEEGCLNVMSGNGMGLVTLFQDVKLLYPNLDNQQLLSIIADSRDELSQERLTKVWAAYFKPDKPEYSWKWARVLCHDYFRYHNIRENVRLCSKFAALLLDTNPGIFEHKDLKHGNIFRDSAIAWANSSKTKLQIINEKLQRKS